MKIAIVHDWLLSMRGGSKVVEYLCEIFPQADVYTLVYDSGKISDTIHRHIRGTSFIQNLPLAKKKHQVYLPFFPAAIENIKLREDYDLIISSSHCVAKGIKKNKGAVHLCYCYTPMRYIWVFFDVYFPPQKFFLRKYMQLLRPYLKRWDLKSSRNVDYFIGISDYIRKRIKDIYGRDSFLLYPPVDTDYYQPEEEKKDYYILVSALVPYKRVDIAVEAFRRINSTLYVVGYGVCAEELKSRAPENVKFLEWVDMKKLRKLYQGCRALIFCAEEDFGIVPLEAGACGRPVICFHKGGASETVVDIRQDKARATGIFFDEQTPESLFKSVQFFEKVENEFNSSQIRENALKFSKDKFEEGFKEIVLKVTGESR